MLGNNRNSSDAATLVLLIGGHSVSSTLLTGQATAAVFGALTVFACFLIFLAALWVSDHLQPKSRNEPKAQVVKKRRKKASKKQSNRAHS